MLEVSRNPLRTKEDLRRLTEEMASCVTKQLSPGKAWLNAGETAAKYPHKTAWMEGFLRPLFGLVPFLAGGGQTPLWDTYLEGIKNGTNPESEEYWGHLQGKEQRVVEMTTLGLALAMIPEYVWEPLTEQERENAVKWLSEINHVPLATNNWLFFPVIVNLGLKKVGEPYDRKLMEEALEKIEACYLSDGWYSDGSSLQRDYYIAFAMHFYSLIYAKLMEKEDPERSVRLKERGRIFARSFIYWFSSQGDALPFGRSLTYRFAMSAFWSALAFADVEAYPWGVVKGIILRNIRWWMKQPIFDERGLLTIGYRYPNLKMAEFYNAPGSPGWAMKTFLILALPDDHPFWMAEEEALPELKEVSVQKHPFMILGRREEGKHIQALTSGQYARFEPSFMAAKYEKFAYSNVFGFSVPGGEFGLEQGAYDSMLALCEENDELYRVRRTCETVQVEERGIYSVWKPWSNVSIQTWLIPCASWHVRVHKIQSGRRLTAAEGGYAVSCDTYESNENQEILLDDGTLIGASFPWGTSAIADLEGNRKKTLVKAHPNSNILYARTEIPTLEGAVRAGETWLACAVLGTKSRQEAAACRENPPRYERKGNQFQIIWNGTTNIYEME